MSSRSYSTAPIAPYFYDIFCEFESDSINIGLENKCGNFL